MLFVTAVRLTARFVAETASDRQNDVGALSCDECPPDIKVRGIFYAKTYLLYYVVAYQSGRAFNIRDTYYPKRFSDSNGYRDCSS